MSEAGIQAKIEGLDEIKAQLLEIEAIMRKLGSDWSPFGGHGGSVAGQPASTVMGGQVVATGGQPAPASAPMPSPAAGGGTPAKQPQPMLELLNAMMGMQGLSGFLSGVNNTIGMHASATAFHRPLHWSQPAVGMIGPSATLLGAGIGALGGPIGMAAGAFIGGAIGGAAQAGLQPHADAAAQVEIARRNRRIQGLGDWAGFDMSPAVAAADMEGTIQGRPLSEAYGYLASGDEGTISAYVKNPELAAHFTNWMRRAGYSPAAVRAGINVKNHRNVDDIVKTLNIGSYDDPRGAAAIARTLEKGGVFSFSGLADYYEKLANQKDHWTFQMQESGVEHRRSTTALNMAQHTGGLGEITAAFERLGKVVESVAKVYEEQEAALRRSGDVDGANLVKSQTAAMREEYAAQKRLEIKAATLGDFESVGMHGMGMGQLLFQRAELTGTSPRQLPWGHLIRGQNTRIQSIRDQLNVEGLTPSERRSLELQLESSINERHMITARQASDSILMFQTDMQRKAAIGIQQASGGGTFGSSFEQMTFGPASAISQIDAQIKSLQFAIGTTMDGRQREQMRNQLIALQTQRTQMGGAHAVAAIEGGIMPMAHNAGMGFLAASQGLASGVGGAEAGRLMQLRIQAMDDQITVGQSRISGLLNAGFSQTSTEVMQAENLLGALRLEREQMKSSGSLPWDVSRFSELTERRALPGFQMAGYGGGGAGLRSNITGQLRLLKGRLGELEENRRSRREGGQWNDAAEREYASERAGIASEALNLQLQYDQGWDQRLISQAYNLPSNVVTAQFNQRSAAFAGIRNRLFGGTAEQMEEFRGHGVARLLSMLGSDDPFGRGEFGMRQAERVKIELEVTVRDGNGSPLESSQRLLRDLPTGLNVQSDSAAKSNKSL